MPMDAPTTLEALACQYDGKIRAFLQAVTSFGSADLDDAVQDVYVKFAANDLLGRFSPDRSAFTSYLYLVCSNVARNRHRASTRRPVSVPFLPLLDLPWSPRGSSAHVRATQSWSVLGREVRAFLRDRHPDLLPVIDRLEWTGRVRKQERLALQAALAPLLAPV